MGHYFLDIQYSRRVYEQYDTNLELLKSSKASMLVLLLPPGPGRRYGWRRSFTVFVVRHGLYLAYETQ